MDACKRANKDPVANVLAIKKKFRHEKVYVQVSKDKNKEKPRMDEETRQQQKLLTLNRMSTMEKANQGRLRWCCE